MTALYLPLTHRSQVSSAVSWHGQISTVPLRYVPMQIPLMTQRRHVSWEQKVSDFAVQSICSLMRTGSKHSVR